MAHRIKVILGIALIALLSGTFGYLYAGVPKGNDSGLIYDSDDQGCIVAAFDENGHFIPGPRCSATTTPLTPCHYTEGQLPAFLKCMEQYMPPGNYTFDEPIKGEDLRFPTTTSEAPKVSREECQNMMNTWPLGDPQVWTVDTNKGICQHAPVTK